MSLQKQFRELAKPYYWINIVLSISYVVAKKLYPICTRLFKHRGEEMCELDSRETEILFFLLIVVMIRSRKTGSVTMVNYLSASFLYTKVANVILWAYSDFRYGIGFLLICVLVSIILPEPSYRGPEHITYFRNMQTFEEELVRDKRINWLICFYTVWNPSCVNFAPIFAELSAEYDLDNLKFGKVDIGRFPDVAQNIVYQTAVFPDNYPQLYSLKTEKKRNGGLVVMQGENCRNSSFQQIICELNSGLINFIKNALKIR
ncbi:unnamed protein product [Ceratitis capitata]|uniref:(Mediterranean fruit fly) hypothetical protein n=1 Tax=Ceratitis capitata TaxID=7213 RepID=A0A811UIQ2_CERCA|nr:unnamed protein product [Ceratitis capitata]